MRIIPVFLLALLGSLTSGLSHGDEDPNSAQMTRRIDALLDEHLHAIGWQPAEACSDASFLRRISLDLTGSPPTGSEVLDFVDDADVDKRSKLVARLLATPLCAAHLAATWSNWMLPEVEGALLEGRRYGLQPWLRNKFAENLRYDRMVSDLLVATGPTQTGPSSFFVALEGKPEKIAAKTARVFMGVQLDCAECHDHPFDQWSQRDFWGFAAYFAQLSTNTEQAMLDGSAVTDSGEGEVVLPGSEEIIAPKPLVKSGVSDLGTGTRRQQLTLWLTTRENPFLARATVNRVWSLLMGRGFIEPIDDMRSLDIASHPQLLKELSDYFASTGFDLRDLLSTIANTRAYSRATEHSSGFPPADSYAVMTTKPLTELQIANSLAKVARQMATDEETNLAMLTSQLGRLRGDASEAKLGIVGALVTLHGDLFESVTRDGSSRLLKALEAPHLGPQQQVQWLFLTVLNRQPSAVEMRAFSEMIGTSAGSSGGNVAGQNGNSPLAETWQSDLLWALMNSSEFAMTP